MSTPANPRSPLQRFKLRCSACGYAVFVRIAPEACPMCGGKSWELLGNIGTAIKPGWRVLDGTGSEVGRVREVISERGSEVLLGVIVESGSLGVTEYHPADRIEQIREHEIQLRAVPTAT